MSRINVVRPDGKVSNIDEGELKNAQDQGYRVASPDDLAVDSYRQENKGISGTVKTALDQFVNQGTMGVSGALQDNLDTPLELAKREALKEDHDIANIAGGVAGFGTSLLYGGPLAKLGVKVVGNVASRIVGNQLSKAAINAGVNLSEHVIGKVGTDLAGKIAQSAITKNMARGAVEGLTFAAPEAATQLAFAVPKAINEGSLGDVDQVAESLMSSGLLGAGISAALPIVGKAFGGVTGLGRKGAQAITGVNEKTIQEYMANPERINKAPGLEDIKNNIDDVYAVKQKAVQDTSDLAKQTHADMEQAYKEKIQELKTVKPPASLANDIMGELENQKQVLGDQSNQAYEALSNSTETIPKNDLLRSINDAKESLKVQGKEGKIIVGESSQSAMKYLDARKAEISQLADEVPLPVAKDIIKKLDPDINYNTRAGEFNSELEKAQKSFRGSISDSLKAKSPEYRAYMEAMAPRAQTLNEASKMFGTPSAATGALNHILTPVGKLKEGVLKSLGEMSGRDFISELEQYKQAQELLNKAKANKLHDILVPEKLQAHNDAKVAYDNAVKEYMPIQRLTPTSTQKIIENQGHKNASIENMKALDNFKKLTGQDIKQMIDDRNTYESFNKERPGGSRRTLLGAVAGMMIHPVAAVLGASAGAATDNFGGRMLKRFIDKYPGASGVLFSEQALKHSAENLDKIKGIMTAKKLTPEITSIMAMQRLLGERKEPRKQQFGELSGALSALNQHPEYASQILSDHIGREGAPNVAMAFHEKMINAIQYLHASMPKAPMADNPFVKHKWEPSDADLAKFERITHAIHEPFSIIKDFSHGTLSKDSVDAVRAVYPKLYSQIQKRIIDHATSEDEKQLTYQKRLQLGMLLDAQSDISLNYVGQLQSAYANPESHEDISGKGPQKMASNAMSPTQSLMYRNQSA